jgi:hypothetical protein
MMLKEYDRTPTAVKDKNPADWAAADQNTVEQTGGAGFLGDDAKS